MIVVAGEALIDLVIDRDGAVEAKIGGAPYNTARAAARLGADVHFVGALSTDRFGRRLASQLRSDGVRIEDGRAVDEPTTLATAEVDERGAATYRFYLAATSAPALGVDLMDSGLAGLVEAGTSGIFFTGGLGLVLEPMATSILHGVAALPDETMFVLDVNCRPAVVADRAEYVARVDRAAARADIVKVSDDDLAYLFDGVDTVDGARQLLAKGPRVVVVTAGAESTTIVSEEGTSVVAVPPISGGVVDSIGAGDTFGAGLLAWWAAAGLVRADVSAGQVERAVAAGHAAAAVVVTRRGADPPHLDDLRVDWPIQTR